MEGTLFVYVYDYVYESLVAGRVMSHSQLATGWVSREGRQGREGIYHGLRTQRPASLQGVEVSVGPQALGPWWLVTGGGPRPGYA